MTIGVVAGVLAAASAACGTTPSPGRSGIPVAAAESETAADLLTQTFVRIEGNTEELAAAHFLAWTKGQAAVESCMGKRGLEYATPRYVSPFANMPLLTGHGSSQWIQPLRQTFHIEEQQRSPYVAYVQEEETPVDDPPSEPEGWDQAADECIPQFDGAMTYENHFPPAYYPLVDDLNSIVTAADGRLDPEMLRSYTQCMHDHGLAADYAFDLTHFVFARYAAAGDPPPVGEPGSDAWQDAVAFEHRLASDDATCRSEIYADGMAIIMPQLDAFLADRQDELNTLDEQWTDLVATAADQEGWTQVKASLLQ